MPKSTGPLFSLSARKTIKKLLTFQRRPSGHVVYKYSKPGDVKPFTPSSGQRDQRDSIAALVAQWQALSQADKAVWNAMAKVVGYIGTGYHYFIHEGGVAVGDYLLLETGDKMLLEDGFGILL